MWLAEFFVVYFIHLFKIEIDNTEYVLRSSIIEKGQQEHKGRFILPYAGHSFDRI